MALARRSLRPYVVGYSGFRLPQEIRHRVLPLNLAVLIIDLTGASRVVTGPRAVATVDGETGWREGVSIALTPAGTQALLGVPMPELAGGSARVADVLGAARDAELAERLAAEPDWASRFALLDRELSGWLADEPHRDELVMHAWQRLQDHTQRLRIGELAEELGVSRRHLQMKFQTEVGLAPKTVARVARFQRSVFMLAQHASLPDIAAECGYADQAHFQREMRAMAGLTPNELCAFLQYKKLPAH